MSQVLFTTINNINVSNTNSGTLLVNHGGTGLTNLINGQLLIGNGINSIIQTQNLKWDNSNNTLFAAKFVGSGSEITDINSSKINIGTLAVSYGGTGLTNLASGQLLVGNNINSIIQSTNLNWNDNILSATNFSGSGSALTSINASNLSSGTLSVLYGGTGKNTLNNNQLLIGNGTNSIFQTTNLVWDTDTLSATKFSGSGTDLTSINASNLNSGTLSVLYGGTGLNNLTSGQILIGNGNNPLIQTNNLMWNNNNTLDVSGNIVSNLQFLSNNNINVSYSWLNDTGTGMKRITNGTIGFFTNDYERFRINNYGDINIDNNTLYVDSINHRIGIGLTNPSTSLHINGNTKIDGSLIVKNLTVNGTTTIIDTNTQTTEQLIITNDGTGTAVIINQLGNQPILQLQSSNINVFQVLNNGFIGIGLTNPIAKVDIFVNDSIGLKINQNNDIYDIINLQSNNINILTLNKNNLIINNKLNLDISGNLIVKGNIYGKNTISKVGFKFTIKTLLDPITLQNVYYYNILLSKYYKTNQTLDNDDISIFRLTTFDTNGDEIEIDFIYVTTNNGGIKKLIKNRLANGDSQIYGWSNNETNNSYLTYYSDSIKTLYCILEPIL
jgi:hypothetical protein